MSDAKEGKANRQSQNSIIDLTEFTNYTARQPEKPADIPEDDRIALTTSNNLHEALEMVKSNAHLDWSSDHSRQHGELEIKVDGLLQEKADLEEEIEREKAELKRKPPTISGKALKLKQRGNGHG